MGGKGRVKVGVAEEGRRGRKEEGKREARNKEIVTLSSEKNVVG